MSNDVNITVTGTNRAGGAFAGAAAGARGLGAEVKKVNPELAALDNQIKKAEHSLVDLGRALRSGVKGFAELNSDGTLKSMTETTTAIKNQRAALSELVRQRKELARIIPSAPNAAPDKGLFGFFAAAAPQAGAEGAKAGSTFASAFQGGLLSAFKALPPEAQAALVAGLLTAATVAAPAIASAINAGILAGVGGGGLIAGIVIAARDPAVKAAWSSVGTEIMTDLTKAAAPFQGQLIGAASLVKDAFKTIMPDLSTTFGALSQAVGPLVDGLMKAAEEAMPGIKAAALASVPLFKAIAAELPAIGAAISHFLVDIADVGGSAAGIFVGILKTFEIGLIGLGSWLNMMGQIAGGAQIVGELITGWIPGMEGAGKQGHAVGHTFEVIKAAADDADQSVMRLQTTVDSFLGKTLSLDDATLRWNQSMTQLKEELKDGARTLDQHTKAGQDNVAALLAAAHAAEDKYDADVALNGITTKNTSDYNDNIDAIIAAAHALGFNEEQVNALIGALHRVPDKVPTEVVAKGFGPAINDAIALKNAIDRVPKFTTASLVLKTTRIGDSMGNFNAHGGIIGAAATGGLRSGFTMVGEAGPEIVQLPTGSKVYPHGQSMSMMEQRGNGNGHVVLEIRSSGAGEDDYLLERLRRAVHVRGGDVQVVIGDGRAA